MYLNGEFKLHEDVASLVAMKGVKIGDFIGSNPDHMVEEDWLEIPEDFILERPWTRHKGSVLTASRLRKRGQIRSADCHGAP